MPEDLDDEALERKLYSKPPSNLDRPEPDPAWMHREQIGTHRRAFIVVNARRSAKTR